MYFLDKKSKIEFTKNKNKFERCNMLTSIFTL